MKQASLIPEATERDPLDFNRTPAWCVELLIPHLGHPRTVLDVGCGDGAIGKALKYAWPNTEIEGIEIDEARRWNAIKAESHGTSVYTMVFRGSWLECAPVTLPYGLPAEYDLIISNPPFGLPALRFLELALQRRAPNGTVAFLLPTHWDQDEDALCGPDAPETKDKELNALRRSHEQYARQRFLDRLRLPDGREGYAKLSIVGRPSFRGTATASDRYAWFMFGEAWAGQASRRLHAIPPLSTSPQLELAAPPSEPTPPVPGATWNPRALEWEAP